MQELAEQESEDLWSRTLSRDEHELDAAWIEFRQQQPTLFAYVLERSETRFEPEIAELMNRAVAAIWGVFLEEEEEFDSIPEEAIEDLERTNAPILQMLTDEDSMGKGFEERFNLLVGQAGDFPQIHLFRLVFEFLDDAHADQNPQLDDFNFALLLFFLRMVIDCLDQA